MRHICAFCDAPPEWCCNMCGALVCEMHARDVRLPDGSLLIVCMGQCYAHALARAGRPFIDRSSIEKGKRP